jgi:hypothetical protein
MGRRFGKQGELLARFLADADAGLTGGRDEAFQAEALALFEALAGDEDVIKAAAASLEGFFNRVHAVENFHELSVDAAPSMRTALRSPAG